VHRLDQHRRTDPYNPQPTAYRSNGLCITAKARIQSQDSTREIWGAKSGAGADFPASTSGLFVNYYHSTDAAYPFIDHRGINIGLIRGHSSTENRMRKKKTHRCQETCNKTRNSRNIPLLLSHSTLRLGLETWNRHTEMSWID